MNHVRQQLRIDAPYGSTSLLKIFLPFFAEQILSNTVGFVNTVVMSGYSDEAVGIIGTANQLVALITVFYASIGGGGAIALCHSIGRKDYEEANSMANCLLHMSILISLVLGFGLSFFSVPLLRLMNLEGAALEEASVYFRIVVAPCFLMGIINSVSAIFRSHNYQHISVIVTFGMNIVNLILCYLAVYRPTLVPLSGIPGVAAANVASRLCAAAAMLLLLKFGPVRFKPKFLPVWKDPNVRPILHYSIPGGVMSFSYSASQAVTTSILVTLGMTIVSAKIYISNLVQYVYLAGFSLSQAHGLVTGWYVGAGRQDEAERLNWRNQKLVWLLNGSLSLLIALFGRIALHLFTKDASIIELCRPILFIDIFVELARGTNHIQEHFLRGAGDVTYPMLTSILCEWLVVIPLTYLLGVVLKLGLSGCWLAFAADEAIRSLVLVLRERSGKWKLQRL